MRKEKIKRICILCKKRERVTNLFCQQCFDKDSEKTFFKKLLAFKRSPEYKHVNYIRRVCQMCERRFVPEDIKQVLCDQCLEKVK